MAGRKSPTKIWQWWITVFLVGGVISIPATDARAVDFPKKPITLICLYGPGSGADIMIRPVAELLSKRLGQRVIVMNKPGGAGTLGITELSKAAPDGYTIGMLNFSPMAITPHLLKVGFKLDDFEYFGAFGEWVNGLYCSGKRPWKDVKDVIAYARANPGKLRHGWSSHNNALPMVFIAEKENLDVRFIPTSGGGESESFLLGGHTDTDCRQALVLKSFTDEQIRFLHPCTNPRWDIWGRPDRPTLPEMGYNYDIRSYIGLGGPKGLPAEIKQALIDSVRKVCNDQEIKDMVFKSGLLPVWIEGPDFKKVIQEGYNRVGPAVKKLEKKK